MNPVSKLVRQGRVLDLGPLPAPRLRPDATAEQALQFLLRGRRGAVVVVEADRPVGIFTERDTLYRLQGDLFTSRRRRNRTPLRDVMSHPPLTVRRQTTLAEAIELMHSRRYRQLVVVDRDGALRGLLTARDLVQYLTDQFPEHTVNLPPRLHQTYDRPSGA